MAEKEKRGFASMDVRKQREIASKGGRAAHAHGTAHEFTTEEARAAGRKGGETVSRNRQHMAEIGRRGGQRSRNTPANPQYNDRPSGSSEQASYGQESGFEQEVGGKNRSS